MNEALITLQPCFAFLFQIPSWYKCILPNSHLKLKRRRELFCKEAISMMIKDGIDWKNSFVKRLTKETNSRLCGCLVSVTLGFPLLSVPDRDFKRSNSNIDLLETENIYFALHYFSKSLWVNIEKERRECARNIPLPQMQLSSLLLFISLCLSW